MKRFTLLLSLLLALLLPVQSWAAIAVDATSSGVEAGSVTTITVSHTVVSNTDGLIYCGVSYAIGGPVSGVTYNSVAMTSAGTRATNGEGGSTEIWRLLAPATGAHNAVATFTAGTEGIILGCVSLTGVNQTTPFSGYATATGNSTAPSVNVTSATNKLVVDALNVGLFVDVTAPTVGANQTQRWSAQETVNYNDWGTGSSEPGVTTTTMSWTLSAADQWAIAAVSVNEAAGGAADETFGFRKRTLQ